MEKKEMVLFLIISSLLVLVIFFCGCSYDNSASFVHYADCKLYCDNPTHIFNFEDSNNYISMAGFVTSGGNGDGGIGLYARYFGFGETYLEEDEGDLVSTDTRLLIGKDDFEIAEGDMLHPDISFISDGVTRQEAEKGSVELITTSSNTIQATYIHKVSNPCRNYQLKINFRKPGNDESSAICRSKDGDGSGWDTIDEGSVNPGKDMCEGTESTGIGPEECDGIDESGLVDKMPDEFVSDYLYYTT